MRRALTPSQMYGRMRSGAPRCSQCHDQILGSPGYVGRLSVEGTAGTRTRGTYAVCQDCVGAGEYQQHLYRLELQARMAADLAPKALTQQEMFS